jgi:hypothetical protein
VHPARAKIGGNHTLSTADAPTQPNTNISPSSSHCMNNANTTLRIAPQSEAKLSKGQLAFNKLVTDIQASRARLATWQTFMEKFHQRVAAEHEPVLKKLYALQTRMVRAFDQALDRDGLTQAERDVLRAVICRMAERITANTEDEGLKAIYNKHSGGDFDAEEAAAVDSMKSAVHEMYGVDLDDIADLDSPEDILSHVQRRVDADARQRAQEKEIHSTRRKNAKKQTDEAKLASEAAQTSLSIREVYRKLVSALHPDREPDAAERERKTSLMQRVNEAYAKKDLLQLLELQLELEQIDAATIANLSDTRLKHFNKVLAAQLMELQHEIASVEQPLRKDFNLHPPRPVEPAAVMSGLTRHIRELKRRVKAIEADLHVPRNLAALKQWIWEYRRTADD